MAEMRGVCKAFGAVHALRGVTLRLMPGDILRLVGDNSAGKSRLTKILTGAYSLDAGKISGAPAHFRSHDDSRDAGIAIISQDFAPRGNMDLAQTILLGRWPQRACSLTVATSMRRRMQCWRVSRSRSTPYIRQWRASQRGRAQSVAIARAISFDPKVVILYEPTASRSSAAAKWVLETMAELKRQGVTQIVTSRRLGDIFEVGDRVVVLKRGANVGERRIKRNERTGGA